MSDSVSAKWPHIDQWLGRYLKKLRNFPDDEYVVLRYELDNPDDYIARIDLLDSHLEIAARECADFSRLIGELRGFGKKPDDANAAILDKLSEIRAVVGLLECGFHDVAFTKTPDLTAERDGQEFAIEVTRIAASGGVHELTGDYEITVITTDDPEDILHLQIVTKAMDKRDQFLRADLTAANHVVWISTGRDYFVVGRYERQAAALRGKMPRHLADQIRLAAANSRITHDYPELAYLAASPEARTDPILLRVEHV